MWTRKLSIDSLNVMNKRILMRADYNVPIHGGKITNNQKIIAGLDSIVYAIVKSAKSVVIMSHLGRPRGIKNMKYSLAPVAEELNTLIQQVHKDPKSLGKYSQVFKIYSGLQISPQVRFLSDCIGSEIEEVCQNPASGSIFLLENLNYYVEEQGYGIDASGNKVISSADTTNLFKQSLRKLGDIYVNDAFSMAHKKHSSVLGMGFQLRAAGLLFKKELQYFTKVLYKPKKPVLAIFGGTRIIDKISLIENLLDKVDEIIIAGAMAFPFLKRLQRMYTGNSLCDVEGSKVVKLIMKKAKKNQVKIHFPVDFITKSRLGETRIETVKSGVEDEWMALDIGPETCSVFRQVIMRARTIVWNGPPGAYELDNSRAGTESMLLDIVKATSRGATSILFGQDTVTCADRWNQVENVSHISSGAEAAKEILRGKNLPGVNTLSDKYTDDISNQQKLTFDLMPYEHLKNEH